MVAGGGEDAFLAEVPAGVEALQEKTQDTKSLLSGPGRAASTSSSVQHGRKYQPACVHPAPSVTHSVSILG